jgi:hypothetical protein
MVCVVSSSPLNRGRTLCLQFRSIFSDVTTMGVYSGSRRPPTSGRRRPACSNCLPAPRGTILFSTRRASKLSPDLRSWTETMFMARKLLWFNASCSTRTCETHYVVYLMFTRHRVQL